MLRDLTSCIDKADTIEVKTLNSVVVKVITNTVDNCSKSLHFYVVKTKDFAHNRLSQSAPPR